MAFAYRYPESDTDCTGSDDVSISFITEEDWTLPKNRYARVGIIRCDKHRIIKNSLALVKTRRGWDLTDNKSVEVTDEEYNLLDTRLCQYNGCLEVRREIRQLKRENADLKLRNLNLEIAAKNYEKAAVKEKESTKSDSMATLKILLAIVAAIILLGALPKASAEKVVKTEKSIFCWAFPNGKGCVPEKSFFQKTGISDGIGTVYDKITENTQITYITRTVSETSSYLLDRTDHYVFKPARENIASWFAFIVSADMLVIVAMSLVFGNGFYILQIVFQCVMLAIAIRGNKPLKNEIVMTVITMCGGYGFLARPAMNGCLHSASTIPLLLASTGNWNCVIASVVVQVLITVYVCATGHGQMRVETDQNGNEKLIPVALRAWLLAVLADLLCIVLTCVMMQIQVVLVLLLVFTWTVWYGLQQVETRDFTIDVSGGIATVKGRKTRRAMIPFVKMQSKRALGAVVTESVYESCFPIRAKSGAEGQSFLMNGKLCVLQHVTNGKDFSVQCAGIWVKITSKPQKSLDLGYGQTLLCYPPPQEMAGKRNCKHSELNMTGWMMVAYINPENGKKEVQVVYMHYTDPQYKGVYEHMPGMSGAPLFNSNGKIVGVHYAGAGIHGLALVIPTYVEEPRVRNPDADLITKLNTDYMACEDVEEKALLKRCLAATSRKLVEEADVRGRLTTYGSWSFIVPVAVSAVPAIASTSAAVADEVEQRATGHLSDHQDVASKAWVVNQLQHTLSEIEAIVREDVEQRKSLKKSKGMTKTVAKATTSGTTINRSQLSRLSKNVTKNIGKMFSEQEYEDLVSKGVSSSDINSMAYERYREQNDDSEYDSDDSEISQTYADHGVQQSFWRNNDVIALKSELEAQRMATKRLEDEVKQFIAKNATQKLLVQKSLRKLRNKVRESKDQKEACNLFDEAVEQMMTVETTRWTWNSEDEPECEKTKHAFDTNVEETLATQSFYVAPFAVTSLTDDNGTSVTMAGAVADNWCEGCKHCKPNDEPVEQASKKRPVEAKCGQRTTCYAGHVRHCTEGCTADDAVIPIEVCSKHCLHWWCHEQNDRNGYPCTTDGCKCAYKPRKQDSKEQKGGKKYQKKKNRIQALKDELAAAKEQLQAKN